MSEIEEFSTLVGDIYDASLDPALWPAALGKVTGFIGGGAASLSSQEIVGRNSNLHFAAGHDPESLQRYFEKYSKINPLFPTLVFFDVERTLLLPDCLPRAEFCRSQFAVEWAAPQGLVDIVLSNLEKSATSCATLVVMRHMRDGFIDDEALRRFALVVPHVRRALLIGKVINLHKVEAAALADSFDALASGMFIVDEASRIVHANRSGYVMLEEADALRAPSGRLGAIDPAADQALRDVFAAAGGGDGALGGRGVAVPLKGRGEERYVAHVLPLTSGARRKAGVFYSAAAVVFVRKATLNGPSAPEAVAEAFRLTPAELRVLFAIVDIGGVPEAAYALGIASDTVKTHLRHLFEKTGAGRQVDLVKLVAGYADPLVS